MQAGGRRFDPVILHQRNTGEASENLYLSLAVYILALADNGSKQQFFNNLEEVKKVIHAEAWAGNCPCGSMKNMGFDCINRIHSSRMDVAQTRDEKTCDVEASNEGLML